MTVGELIEELEKIPKHKRVDIGTMDTDCGEAERVLEYHDYVEIESDKDLM